MADYYSYEPRFLLAQPLVLAGQVGAGTAQVARAMSARTGLPCAEVDRLVESQAGRSLARIVRDEGPAALRAPSLAALERALRRRPAGFIALGSAALSAGDLESGCEGARLVYIRRPAAVLLRRIRAQLESAPGSLFQFQLGIPSDENELGPLLDAREPGLRRAQVLYEAGDRHPHTIADELLASLDRIASVEEI